MTPSAPIDTTGLLTILGVIAAVWALISPTNRLRLRFCTTWVDWVVGGSVFCLVHYLMYATVLEQLGLYYSLGPWKWGLDSSSTVYLLLSVALYFFWRTRFPTLARGRLHVFRELIENLHLTKRYDELVLLAEPQLPTLISLTRQRSCPMRWIENTGDSNDELAAVLRRETAKHPSAWRNRWRRSLHKLKSWCAERDQASLQAREILLNLVTSPELIVHLAQAHPHFCLKLLEADEAIRSDFIAQYIDALLDATGSRLYVELKNNQNLNGGSRLYLPESNRLLRFFFADAATAVKNGLEAAIGESVCRRLDEDKQLARKLNEPLGSYQEVGRFRCPINSGITLFEIMVHEGIHQGLQDHMWLHYFGHFAEKILKQMPGVPDEEVYLEWPTPFHYLLGRLVSVATDWAEQCVRIDDSEIPQATRCAANFDRHYISKQATKVIGAMLQRIIPSKELSVSFKSHLLEIAIRSYIRLQCDPRMADVAASFLKAVIVGSDLNTKNAYRQELSNVFGNLDQILQNNAFTFKTALDASLQGGGHRG